MYISNTPISNNKYTTSSLTNFNYSLTLPLLFPNGILPQIYISLVSHFYILDS